MNLLEMTQDILNDMDSDPVNSISDTVESEQVAQIIKTTYYDIIDSRNWGRTRKVLTLTESSATTPTVFTIPNNVSKITQLRYQDENESWKELQYKEVEDFLELVLGYKSTDSDVTSQTIPNSDLTFYVRNNIQPTYWTSFDDYYVVMDSYLSTTDTFLKQAKLLTWGEVTPSWTASDTFVPTFPDTMFSYLLAEAKQRCFQNIKQAVSPTVARQARKGEIRAQTSVAWKQNGAPERPNFGR